MHYLKTKVGTIQDICPGVDNSTLTFNNGLIEVESVEVKCHGADAEGGKPDSHDWPRSEEEMQTSRIVKRCILENQTTEVTVSGNDVVGLFFLTKLVTVVLGLSFSSFTDQRRGHETTVHSREKRSTEDTCDTQHMEGMHQDVVLCLEDKHVVECTRDAERHTIRERSLTERIDQEDCGCCCNRCRVCNTDPRTHTETVGQFPLTTHIAEDTNEEVEDYELVRTTVIQPLIKGCCFPDGIEVKSNSVGRGHNSTRDDVVTIHERSRNRFANAIDVHRRSTNECDDKANGCCQQCWNHQHTKPTNVEAVVSRRNPVAKGFPVGRVVTLLLKS